MISSAALPKLWWACATFTPVARSCPHLIVERLARFPRQVLLRGDENGGHSPSHHVACALVLLPADEEQVEQREQRGERRRYVRAGSWRQEPLGASGLAARKDTVAGKHPV